MAASNTDKFKKVVRKWTGTIGSGGVPDGTTTTIPLASATNLPTDTAVVASIDRVDANGNLTPAKEEVVIGVVSGSDLTDCIRGVEGTAQAHSAGAVVEILITAKGWNELVDGILEEHNQDGTHSSATVATLKASGSEINTGTEDAKIVTPKAIADSLIVKPSGTPSQGDILYYNGSAWARLGAGTSGQFLKTQGTGANPTWSNINQNCRFLVCLSSSQSISNGTETKIQFDSEVFDTGNNFDNSTNYRFTAPVAGYYQISGYVAYYNVSAACKLSAILKKNGSTYINTSIQLSSSSSANQPIGPTFSLIIYLNVNDYLELYGSQNSGSNASIWYTIANTYFCGYLVSV